MQETQIRPLIWEEPTGRWTAKRMHHTYWACALEPRSCNSWAHLPRLLKPVHPRACALPQEEPPQWEAQALQLESSPGSLQQKKPAQQRKPASQ